MGIPQSVEIYLVPPRAELNYATIVLLLCYFYRGFAARAMASGRSSDMDHGGSFFCSFGSVARDIFRPFIRHYMGEVV